MAGLPKLYEHTGALPNTSGEDSISLEIAEPVIGDPDDNQSVPEPTEAPSEPLTESVSESAQASERPRDAHGRFAKKAEDALAESLADDSPSSAPPAEEWDAELMQRAEQDYGISADDARSMGADALRRAMAIIDGRTASYALNQLEAAAEPHETNGHAETNGHVPAESEPPPEYEYTLLSPIEKPKINLDPEIFEPEAVDAINQLNDAYHRQLTQQQQVLDAVLYAVKTHHESLSQFTGQSQAETQARAERDMDSWFAELGDAWVDEFGTGPAAELPENSPQLQKRQAVARQMKGLGLAPTLEGRPPLALSKALFERAFGSLYSQQMKDRARRDIASALERRRSQAVAPASGQHRQQLSGRAAAIARQRAFDRKAGLEMSEPFPVEV